MCELASFYAMFSPYSYSVSHSQYFFVADRTDSRELITYVTYLYNAIRNLPILAELKRKKKKKYTENKVEKKERTSPEPKKA